MSGYAQIHRSLLGHPAFRNESETMAFAWLVLKAAWRPARVRYKGRTLTLKRGQLAISQRDMAAAFERDKAWIERLWKRLKAENMVVIAAEAGVAVITICNYEEYQAETNNREALCEAGVRQGSRSRRGSGEALGEATGEAAVVLASGDKQTEISSTQIGGEAESEALGEADDEAAVRQRRGTEQEEKNNSVPEGTGEPPPDPVKLMFDAGVKLLGKAGVPEKQARSLVGKWRAQAGNDEVRLAISEAVIGNISDPVPWLTKRLSGFRKSGNAPTSQGSFREHLKEELAREEARAGATR